MEITILTFSKQPTKSSKQPKKCTNSIKTVYRPSSSGDFVFLKLILFVKNNI